MQETKSMRSPETPNLFLKLNPHFAKSRCPLLWLLNPINQSQPQMVPMLLLKCVLTLLSALSPHFLCSASFIPHLFLEIATNFQSLLPLSGMSSILSPVIPLYHKIWQSVGLSKRDLGLPLPTAVIFNGWDFCLSYGGNRLTFYFLLWSILPKKSKLVWRGVLNSDF